MIRRLLFLAVTSVSFLSAQYAYDAINPYYPGYGPWQWNGANQFPGADSSVIYTGTISGANPNDYEVFSQLAWPAGNLIHFLRANSLTVQPGAGSYISVELDVGTPSGGGYPSQLTVSQSINGTITTLANTSVVVTFESTFRSVVWGTNLRVIADGKDVLDLTTPLTTGSPGFGAGSVQPNLGSLRVGHHDTVAPMSIPAEPVASSLLPNSVSLKWPIRSTTRTELACSGIRSAETGSFSETWLMFGLATAPSSQRLRTLTRSGPRINTGMSGLR